MISTQRFLDGRRRAGRVEAPILEICLLLKKLELKNFGC